MCRTWHLFLALFLTASGCATPIEIPAEDSNARNSGQPQRDGRPPKSADAGLDAAGYADILPAPDDATPDDALGEGISIADGSPTNDATTDIEVDGLTDGAADGDSDSDAESDTQGGGG